MPLAGPILSAFSSSVARGRPSSRSTSDMETFTVARQRTGMSPGRARFAPGGARVPASPAAAPAADKKMQQNATNRGGLKIAPFDAWWPQSWAPTELAAAAAEARVYSTRPAEFAVGAARGAERTSDRCGVGRVRDGEVRDSWKHRPTERTLA